MIFEKTEKRKLWGEYEEPLLELESSLEESNLEDSSLDEPTSEALRLWGGQSGAGEQTGGQYIWKVRRPRWGLQLEVDEHILRPIWKDDAGSYPWGIQGCGLSATTHRKKDVNESWKNWFLNPGRLWRCFFSQHRKNQSCNKNLIDGFPSAPPLRKNLRGKNFKRWRHYLNHKLKLGDLLCLKTK